MFRLGLEQAGDSLLPGKKEDREGVRKPEVAEIYIIKSVGTLVG